MACYIILALFGGVGWHWHALLRIFLTHFTLLCLIIHRINVGDTFRQGWVLSILGFMLVEASNYIGMKAKVKLFIKITQQKQQ